MHAGQGLSRWHGARQAPQDQQGAGTCRLFGNLGMLLAMLGTTWTLHSDVHLMGGFWFPQLAFTGSTEVGKLIATETAKNVVPTTLELVRHASLATTYV
jgi:hypothetical protein